MKPSIVVPCLIFAFSLPATAANGEFDLENRTGSTIVEVYLARHGTSDSWGSNVLAQDVLPDRQTVHLHAPVDSFAKAWDLRLVYQEGTSANFNDGFDLTRASQIKLTTLADGTTRASYVYAGSTDLETSALDFIHNFWSKHLANDPDGWADAFAADANYCYYDGNGPAGRAFIRYDRAKLIDRYPFRHYSFNAPTIRTDPNTDSARASYSFSYSYNGHKPVSGYCRVYLTLHYESGRWLISDYDEKVDRR